MEEEERSYKGFMFYGQQSELIIVLIFQVVLVPLYTCQNQY